MVRMVRMVRLTFIFLPFSYATKKGISFGNHHDSRCHNQGTRRARGRVVLRRVLDNTLLASPVDRGFVD